MDQEKIMDESMEKILEFLEQKKYFMARDEMLKFNEADIAEMFEELFDNEDKLEKAVVVYRLLPKDVSVEVFSLLPVDDQLKIVEGINPKELNYIVQELDFDDKIDILEELPANIVNSILENTPKEERHLINAFLNYPEDSAGSLMTPEYISLDKDMTAKEAMAHIKKVGMDAETIYTCYVKDTGRKLIGIVSLSTLVIADDNTKVRDLMRSEFVYLNVYDDQEEVAAAFKKYDFLAMPVVDKEGRLVGIITVDDILDVIEEEDTEDIERMAGIVDVSDSWDSDYLDISVWEHAKNRLPWLLILMVAYIFTGMIVSSYEAKLSQVHAHADGNRRQYRLPGIHPYHKRSGHRRGGVERCSQDPLEGSQDRHRGRSHTERLQFLKSSLPGRAERDDSSHHLHRHDIHSYNRQITGFNDPSYRKEDRT